RGSNKVSQAIWMAAGGWWRVDRLSTDLEAAATPSIRHSIDGNAIYLKQVLQFVEMSETRPRWA
ncbi:MAG: hypothetical protein ACK2UU_04255, partial [Anaerolineae bacterium]